MKIRDLVAYPISLVLLGLQGSSTALEFIEVGPVILCLSLVKVEVVGEDLLLLTLAIVERYGTLDGLMMMVEDPTCMLFVPRGR